jgi:microcystin-dependent protein
MSTPYLGQISMFGGNFAPTGWALCNGQTLPISQYTALFSLLGTTYGGNGVSTFNLPNLQSRLPVHEGTGPGLSTYVLGQSAGTPTVTIDMTTMPMHTHTLNATQTLGTTGTIGNTVLPAQPAPTSKQPLFYAAPVAGQPPPVPVQLAGGSCGPAGGSQPHTNMMPSLCITFIIALSGIYPSRS